MKNLPSTLELLQVCLDEVKQVTKYFGIYRDTNHVINLHLLKENFYKLVNAQGMVQEVVEIGHDDEYLRRQVNISGFIFFCLIEK